MQTIDNLLTRALITNKLSLPTNACEKLTTYLNLLQTWNRTFNLTAITEPHEMVYLHIIDSLIALPYLQGTRCLDVGTGAGLPGIPLALADTNKHWTLLDKNSKKTRFLTQACAELEIKNIEVVHSRTEDFHRTPGFDTIISRAFSSLRLFLETTEHLLNPSGIWLAMKGKYPEEELSDIPDRFTLQNVVRLDIQGIEVERHLICFKKD